MNITFIGTSYVGLVSGVMLSYLGHNVTCIDIDKRKIDALNSKVIPIYEPGLEVYVEQCRRINRLNFISSYSVGLSKAELVFIAVGTPSYDSGEADLSAVYEALNQISEISSTVPIVIKSTVPPGTCQAIKEYLKRKGAHNPIAANPEFLREGSAIDDFLKPDRIILGISCDPTLCDLLRSVYKSLIIQGIEVMITDLNTAELIKYASNSFLATKIAFMNEMANLCEIAGGNINDLAFGLGLDKRIGERFLKVGPGFGGSCFPKDLLALINLGDINYTDLSILKAVVKSNNKRPELMVKKIGQILKGVKDKRIAVLGVTFKAGTDDIRSSPAIEIIKLLIAAGAQVSIYDPAGMHNAKKIISASYCNMALEAIMGADAMIIATEWPEFADIDWQRVWTLLNKPSPVIIDLRNMLDIDTMNNTKFAYYRLGS